MFGVHAQVYCTHYLHHIFYTTWAHVCDWRLSLRTCAIVCLLLLFLHPSGDWPMIPEQQKLQLPGIPNRAWYSMQLNPDEGYSLLGNLGLSGNEGKDKTSTPCVHASSFNTLLNTGNVQRDTRTAGSYGGTKSLHLCPYMHKCFDSFFVCFSEWPKVVAATAFFYAIGA